MRFLQGAAVPEHPRTRGQGLSPSVHDKSSCGTVFPVVDLLLPLLLSEAKKNETVREIGRRRAFEAMKSERYDPVMYYDPDSNHIVVIFINYAVVTTDYASLHPLLQGFVDGFFENTTQISQCDLE
ncbi:hypothetical protein QR680_017354 [Steinernema hermaphroditum]|uniref:Uncharacterized protein n=1 Tax=Steinernema hermaphroditum TaxID=289476 RepID=A0AA39HE83_9BILA|nr:hypothetical protein QR680_017354 [Steinernema hermaphroditum]